MVIFFFHVWKHPPNGLFLLLERVLKRLAVGHMLLWYEFCEIIYTCKNHSQTKEKKTFFSHFKFSKQNGAMRRDYCQFIFEQWLWALWQNVFVVHISRIRKTLTQPSKQSTNKLKIQSSCNVQLSNHSTHWQTNKYKHTKKTDWYHGRSGFYFSKARVCHFILSCI